MQLVDKAVRKAVRFANYAGRSAAQGGKAECCIGPLPQDRRFAGDGWHRWPYNFIHQAFLLNNGEAQRGHWGPRDFPAT
jgi:polyhydroxyalkanoate synthase subunit PhaC